MWHVVTSQGERVSLKKATAWLVQLVLGVNNMHQQRVRVEQAKTPACLYSALAFYDNLLLRSKCKEKSRSVDET